MVPFGDALLGWLVSAAGTEMFRRLRGDRVKPAMRMVVADAVDTTLIEIIGKNTQRAQGPARELRRALLSRRDGISVIQVSDRAELATALRKWLDVTAGRGPEQGWPATPEVVAECLARNIVAGIHGNARAGGVLAPLSEWLWRNEAVEILGHIRYKVDQMPLPDRSRGHLPGQMPDFTGRSRAVEELSERLAAHDPSGTVVSISSVTGMAGVGKTALALHVAHRFAARYPDGQFFIDLHGYTPGLPPVTPLVALEQLLDQAGVPSHSIPPDLERRQARWRVRMAGRTALVVLDNALNAAQVAPLLPMSPGSPVIITSRSRSVAPFGTRPLWLDVMTPQESASLLVRLVGADRCQDVARVARVTDLAGHLPLAVTVVAGRMNSDPTLELADVLTDLADTNRRLGESDAEYAGTRTSFEVSIDRLDEVTLHAFRLVGVHPGPTIGVEQFAALLDRPPGQASQLLRDLGDRNLVRPTRRSGSRRCYEQHDLLRDYARDQAGSSLSPAYRTAALHRLTTWYLATLDTAVRHWYATASTSVDDAPGRLRLDSPDDTRAWLVAEEDNLIALTAITGDRDAATLGTLAARRLYLLDHHVAANRLAQRSRETFQLLGDRGGAARAQRILADVARATGDFPAASRLSSGAVLVSREVGDHLGEALARQSLGDVLRLRGSLAESRQQFERSVEICREIHEQRGEGHALRGLGDAFVAVGQFTTAAQHYTRGAQLMIDYGEQLGANHIRRGLGDVAVGHGDLVTAAELYRSAFQTYQELADRYAEARTLRDMGDLVLLLHQQTVAEQHHTRALTICQEIGDRLGEAHALRGLGDVAAGMQHWDDAERHYAASAALAERLHDLVGLSRACWGLGQVEVARQRPDQARKLWSRALLGLERTGSPLAARVREALHDLPSSDPP
ncbi:MULTISPECIES: tetratricopeptide repeat protein [unclassified Micromonospora]|uniref:tetratricopeptide repeat protein n=1 Tax=unclassified Micromonospora TaxID=2617518 RepID=UPI00103309ED|nr:MULTISPECIES: tetratricopeptide repeat protein [unclassified Micromonospora]QKW15111.1 tetratricopeptide repeat protein [Verrucosispora sp. NA02020]TBL45045.1 tetratricopeptide repeat protein [Verrucosispora sp. SN26_14.1]